MEAKKRKWDQTSLKIAVTKVLPKELTFRKASSRYNIPESTLHHKRSIMNPGEEVMLQQKSVNSRTPFHPNTHKF